MYKEVKPLFFVCQSPMHVGSGQDLGIVDMPIQRERHTSFPKIEGSSLKGALRENVEYKSIVSIPEKALGNAVTLQKVFGFDGSDVGSVSKRDLENAFKNKDFAGAIGFSDARLLLFPVKSMKGVFAWITCPMVLRKFEKDIALFDSSYQLKNLNEIKDGDCIVLSNNSNVTLNGKVILEEYTFNAEVKEDIHFGNYQLNAFLAADVFKNSFLQDKASQDIVVLSDNDFKDFVNLSTEVITRTKINNQTGTVDNGALFTEEYLPSESVLYTLVMAHDEFTKESKKMTSQEVLEFFSNNLNDVVQIGGNATLGKGIVTTNKSFLTKKSK